jgi:hypothetical protein
MRLLLLLLLPLLLTGCTPDGYPSTDVEMVCVTIMFLGVLALVGWVLHLMARS